MRYETCCLTRLKKYTSEKMTGEIQLFKVLNVTGLNLSLELYYIVIEISFVAKLIFSHRLKLELQKEKSDFYGV